MNNQWIRFVKRKDFILCVNSIGCVLEQLPGEACQSFLGVRKALARAHRYADIAVFSIAALNTVLEEWDTTGLLEYTDIVLSEKYESREQCIHRLLQMGYKQAHIMLCGAEREDLQAAQNCGICFFPILAERETESWSVFAEEGLKRFRESTYTDEYQQNQIDLFLAHIKEE